MDTELGWLLICTALVLFMTPGLAFFYGGLVKAKSVVSMMMLSFGAMGIVWVLWVLFGAGGIGAIGDSGFSRLFGNPFQDVGLLDATQATDGTLASAAFGGTFAVITVALVSGAIADRAKFWPWMIFAGLFSLLVYFPVQAWVFNPDNGWIYNFGSTGTLDWAGGTAVHQNAGAAALALALVLGRRKVGFTKEEAVPHNVPLVLIGAAILWFGWFGFNAGVFGADAGQTSLIILNTIVCPAAALIGFIVIEQIKDGKSTAVGAASGIVAGLVAITPACAHLTPVWAMVLGVVAGVVTAFAIDLKYKLGFDDSLDVVGLHLVAGFIGCVWLGFFAFDPGTGLAYGGNTDQLVAQVVSSVAVIAYSFVVSFVIGLAIEKTIGFRVKEEDEVAGVDLQHGEAYAFD